MEQEEASQKVPTHDESKSSGKDLQVDIGESQVSLQLCEWSFLSVCNWNGARSRFRAPEIWISRFALGRRMEGRLRWGTWTSLISISPQRM